MKKATNDLAVKIQSNFKSPFPKHLSLNPFPLDRLLAFSRALDFSFSSFIHNQKPVQRSIFSTSKKLVASQITQSRTLLEINRYPHYDLQGLAPFRFTFGLITSPDNSPTFRLSLNILSGLFIAPNDLLIN